METIKELGHLSKYWKPSQSNGGDVGRLYELLFIQGLDREEAGRRFREDGKSASQFRNVLSDLVDKLIGGLITGNFNQFTPVQRAHFSTLKKYIGAEMLILTGNKFDGVALASNTLQLASEYGQVDIALSLARRLTYYYSNIEPNGRKRKFYKNKVLFFQGEINKEIDIELLANELNYYLQIGGRIDHVVADLENYEEGIYWRFNWMYFHSKILVSFYLNDLDAVLDNCERAANCFSKLNKMMPYITRWMPDIYRIPIWIGRGEYGLAESALYRCLTFPSPGEKNWHMTVYYKAMLGLYSSKYAMVIQAYTQAKNVRNKSNAKEMLERWKIVEAYLFFLHKLGKVNMPGTFRLHRFLNEVSASSQHKAGQNVAIVVAHLLHLLADIHLARKKGNLSLANKKKKAYMAKADTVPAYIRNHIARNKKHKRSRLFLKMLARIDHADYYKARVSKMVSKWYAELKRTPKTINTDLLEAELIPYENLWGLVHKMLK